MRITITYIFIVFSMSICAQELTQDSIKKSVSLDEVVISVNKSEEMKREIGAQVTVITAKQIQFDNPQTSADVLANTGQILVQKSQQGGGSPILRGFEASRVLLVIDGVRMNNLIYRSGHLQNILTLDPNMMEKIEIFYGPSSTVYGSDALGGTVHFMTKKPQLNLDGKKPLTFNAMTRYSSVNNGQTTGLNFNLGFKKIASLTSITYNNFGDLRMGKNKNPFYDTLFGLRKMYASRVNGKDSGIINDNEFIQSQSGYSQIDLIQKVLFRQSEKLEHNVNIQYSNSSNVPRYDRLTDIRNGKPRFAEWYYGPQTRTVVAYDLNLKNTFGFDMIHVGLNSQWVEESRIVRNFGSNNLDTRIEDVGVIGYNLDFQKQIKKVRLRFGFDGQANKLTSTAKRDNIITEEVTPLSTRYPDGKNTLNHNAIYITETSKISAKFNINSGIRVGISTLNSEVKNNSFFNLPVTEVEQQNLTHSAFLGLIYNPIQAIKLSYQVSTGYRVPNIDDLSKIFETASGNVIIPNPNLKPERTLTNEIGINFKPNKSMRIETSFWHTFLSNAITTEATTLNGESEIYYYDDSTKSKVFSNQNTGEATIYGYSIGLHANLTSSAQVYANVNFTKGTVISTNPKQPLDHISPMVANLGYSKTYKKVTTEANIMFNGKKDIKDYSNSGEDNLLYAPKGGMPAWMIFNLRASYQLPRNFLIQTGIENLFDTNYRVFASGINGPGRNIYLTLRFKY